MLGDLKLFAVKIGVKRSLYHHFTTETERIFFFRFPFEVEYSAVKRNQEFISRGSIMFIIASILKLTEKM